MGSWRESQSASGRAGHDTLNEARFTSIRKGGKKLYQTICVFATEHRSRSAFVTDGKRNGVNKSLETDAAAERKAIMPYVHLPV